jgi:alcohol dehydrogenase class IV
MLPAALTANRDVSRADLATLGRATIGKPFSYDTLAAEALIERIEQICRSISIPHRLSEIGVRAEQIPALVKSSRGNSMSGNPRELEDQELASILEARL